MRVEDARSGNSLPESKISVLRCERQWHGHCGSEQDLLVDNETVKEEYQLKNTTKSERLEFYRIEIYNDEKYSPPWAGMKIICPGNFSSCQKCKDSLDTLIPSIEKNEVKPVQGASKKWVISFTWPRTGSAILFDEKNFLVRGLKVNGTGKSWKTKDNMCTFPYSDQQSDRSCSVEVIGNRTNLLTIKLDENKEFAYEIRLKVGAILDYTVIISLNT